MTQRTERIDELLRQEIGAALERDVTDPRIGFVTVTDVETTPDLSRARVWVSVIGTPEERKETLAALRRAMPYVRHGLGSKIRLRRIPELEVRVDDTVERGTRVLQILNELEAGRTPDWVDSTGESLPTPVPRLPHEGDAADGPSLATSAEAVTKPGAKAQRRGDRKEGHGKGAQAGRQAGRRRAR